MGQLLRSACVLLRIIFGLALTTAAALFVACGSVGEPSSPDREGSDIATTSSASASPDATANGGTPAASATASPEATAAISFPEFCAQAELSITRWELPPALTDQIERGTIELRYRIPPGAEPLTIWMGVDIEVGDVTIGDVIRLDPGLAATFANADPSAPFPASVMSHGFDVELDGRTRTIEVIITLPSEQAFDGTEGWRWSDLTETPFEVSDPWVLAMFRADGVRVRLDGEFCTPVFVPLP